MDGELGFLSLPVIYLFCLVLKEMEREKGGKFSEMERLAVLKW